MRGGWGRRHRRSFASVLLRWLARVVPRRRLRAAELNPTELLNQDVKTNALGRRRPHTQDELIGDTRSYLRSRQRTPPDRRQLLRGEISQLRQSGLTAIY